MGNPEQLGRVANAETPSFWARRFRTGVARLGKPVVLQRFSAGRTGLEEDRDPTIAAGNVAIVVAGTDAGARDLGANPTRPRAARTAADSPAALASGADPRVDVATVEHLGAALGALVRAGQTAEALHIVDVLRGLLRGAHEPREGVRLATVTAIRGRLPR